MVDMGLLKLPLPAAVGGEPQGARALLRDGWEHLEGARWTRGPALIGPRGPCTLVSDLLIVYIFIYFIST